MPRQHLISLNNLLMEDRHYCCILTRYYCTSAVTTYESPNNRPYLRVGRLPLGRSRHRYWCILTTKYYFLHVTCTVRSRVGKRGKSVGLDLGGERSGMV